MRNPLLTFAVVLGLLCPAVAGAAPYAEAGVALLQVRADTGTTNPLQADIRLGYALKRHALELALMPGLTDDELNQLKTDIPKAAGLFYRYTANPRSSLHLDLLLGYSLLDIRSSYVNVEESTGRYRGLGYGLSLEEGLKSLPQLKFRIDLMQLYRGERIRVNSFALRFRYAF